VLVFIFIARRIAIDITAVVLRKVSGDKLIGKALISDEGRLLAFTGRLNFWQEDITIQYLRQRVCILFEDNRLKYMDLISLVGEVAPRLQSAV
jgi:hypothetical protein